MVKMIGVDAERYDNTQQILSRFYGEILPEYKVSRKITVREAIGDLPACRPFYDEEHHKKRSMPDNLYIIGTMNTAAKSIGGIDYAIRRRFLFFEQLPDVKVIKTYKSEKGTTQEELNEQASKLFEYVEKVFEEDYLSPEYRKEDVQIGHTYFLVDSKDKLMKRFEYQIIPILKEYYKDGIISFDVSDATDGFNGFLNCIAGKINMTSQREVIEKIFNDLIA